MLSLLFREYKVFFTGDAIPLKNDIPNYDNYLELMGSLNTIRKQEYQTLLTSWTPAYTGKAEIEKLFAEGEAYMKQIDKAVKENYHGEEDEPLQFCRKTAAMLELPPFLANAIVDRAFRSHF